MVARSTALLIAISCVAFLVQTEATETQDLSAASANGAFLQRLRGEFGAQMLSPAEIKKKWCPKKGRRRRKKKGQAKSSELGEDSSARSGLANGVYLPRAFAVAPTDAFTGNDGKRYKNP